MSYYGDERAALGEFWAVRDDRKEALTKISWAYVASRALKSVAYERFVIRLEMSKWEARWPHG